MKMFDEQPSVQPNNAASLKRFTQTYRSCVVALQKLNVGIDENNKILVYFMLKKERR